MDHPRNQDSNNGYLPVDADKSIYDLSTSNSGATSEQPTLNSRLSSVAKAIEDPSDLYHHGSSGYVSSKANNPQSSKPPTTVLYRIEWKDTISDRRQNFESETPFENLEITTENVDKATHMETSNDKPAFEVVTSISGVVSSANVGARMNDSLRFSDISISSAGIPTLTIYSKALLDVIRDVVQYYPYYNLAGDTLVIEEPYEVLVHHFEKLENVRAQIKSR